MPTESDCEPAGERPSAPGGEPPLGELERRLLNEFQRDFPMVPRPFAEIAGVLDTSEQQVLRTLRELRDKGYVSRVGPVFAPHRVGYSVLAAMAVPASEVERIAELINGYEEVNHNYEREHAYNLWFVVTGEDASHVERVIAQIETRTGLDVMRLPLERAYHIDLGFELWL